MNTHQIPKWFAGTGIAMVAALALFPRPTIAQATIDSVTELSTAADGTDSLLTTNSALVEELLSRIEEASAIDVQQTFEPLSKTVAASPGEAALIDITRGDVRVTAALTRANGKATYLFLSNGTYLRTSANKAKGIDDGYPAVMPGGWKNIPSSWSASIDAALPYNGSSRGYMWREGQFLRLSDVTKDPNYPTPMPGGWGNFPELFKQNIDAALYDPEYGRNFFFSGTRYLSVSNTTADKTQPGPFPGHFAGLPDAFLTGIDAATYRNGHVYMIKGGQYVRLTGSTVDAGYPKYMTSWPE